MISLPKMPCFYTIQHLFKQKSEIEREFQEFTEINLRRMWENPEIHNLRFLRRKLHFLVISRRSLRRKLHFPIDLRGNSYVYIALIIKSSSLSRKLHFQLALIRNSYFKFFCGGNCIFMFFWGEFVVMYCQVYSRINSYF